MGIADRVPQGVRKSPLIRTTYHLLRRGRRWLAFRREFDEFQRLARDDGRLPLQWSERQACLDDRTDVTRFDAHYVYHTAWAARCVAQIRPAYHVDISSMLYFATLVSAFVPVRFYDYRPANVSLEGLVSSRADLMGLPFDDASVPSLSCMHVVEHVGLGRYGDPIDPRGDLKAIAELTRVLAPGGSLLFVVPVGRPRIVFNAHRIYAFRQVRDAFPQLRLKQFALVTDGPDAAFIRDAPEPVADAQHYGCGCFWFERP